MSGEGSFEPVRFNEFRSITDALLSDRIQATFILAPLAMHLREEGKPVRIVYLGHRAGPPLMPHNRNNTEPTRAHKEKPIPTPSRSSNQYLIIVKPPDARGMSIDDVNFIEMPPPQ